MLKHAASKSTQLSQTEQNRLSALRPSLFIRLMRFSPTVTAFTLNDDGTLTEDAAVKGPLFILLFAHFFVGSLFLLFAHFSPTVDASAKKSEDAVAGDGDASPPPPRHRAWSRPGPGGAAGVGESKRFRPLRTVALLSDPRVAAANADGASGDGEVRQEDVPEWVSRAERGGAAAPDAAEAAAEPHRWTEDTLPFIGGEHACVSIRLYQLLFARVVRARALCAQEATRRYNLKSTEAGGGAPWQTKEMTTATPTANRYTSDDARNAMSQPSPAAATVPGRSPVPKATAGAKRKRGGGGKGKKGASAAASTAPPPHSGVYTAKESDRAHTAFQSYLVALSDAIQGGDLGQYEERCRELMGTGAYIVFTIDKLLIATLRQVRRRLRSIRIDSDRFGIDSGSNSDRFDVTKRPRDNALTRHIASHLPPPPPSPILLSHFAASVAVLAPRNACDVARALLGLGLRAPALGGALHELGAPLRRERRGVVERGR